jgi:hypothetical protein
MFPLCSSCVDTMNQGYCTHSEDKRCLVGVCVVDEFYKAVELSYSLFGIFEFWEYVTRYDNETNSGTIFAQYFIMFLKLK